MNVAQAVRLIEKEWGQPEGALGMLRTGVLDTVGLGRLLRILQAIEIGDESQVDRRFVAVVWYMPIFVSWQKGRVLENGGNSEIFDFYENRIHDAVVDLLGYP